jgi:hypothetical protein
MLTVLVPGGTTLTTGAIANLFSWTAVSFCLLLVMESSILGSSGTTADCLAPSKNQ